MGESSRTAPERPPIALVRKGMEDTEAVAWACGSCGEVRLTQAEASSCYRCTRPICACGAPCENPYTACHPCRAKRLEAKRAALADNTASLTVEQWYADRRGEGCEMLVDDEGNFYFHPEDIHFDVAPGDLPQDSKGRRFLWRTAFRAVLLDEDDVHALVESACEEHHEEVGADIDSSGLVDAVARWNEAHATVGSWFADYSARVLISFPADDCGCDPGPCPACRELT